MTSPLLDATIGAEAHIQSRLEREPILWLGTVTPRGEPRSVPVWFRWADPIITIFSQPGTAKVARLRANPAVSIALDTARGGGDVVLGNGHAVLAASVDVDAARPAFEAKYAPMLGAQSFDGWYATFSQPIVVTVERLVAWQNTAEGLDHRSLPRR